MTLFDEIEYRIVRHADGGFGIDLLMGDDERPIARLVVHEEKETKLFRKLAFSLSTRQDDRVRKSYWNMALTTAKARLLR